MKFQSAVKVMGSKNSLPRGEGDVDVRFVRGLYRYRFWFKPHQLADVNAAVAAVIKDTGYLAESAALDALCTWYLTGTKPAGPQIAEIGTKGRRLFHLHEDQHENVQLALKVARKYCKDDAEALTLIARQYLAGR